MINEWNERMKIRKLMFNQTYARSNEPEPETFDVDVELRFDNLEQAAKFHQKLITLIQEEIKNA